MAAAVNGERFEEVRVGSRWFRIRKPSRPFDVLVDETLDRPDGVFPWWAMIWPGALALATDLLERAPLRGRALDLGCGLGLSSLGAAAAGLSVTATDLEAEALLLTRQSADDNGVALAGVARLDWHQPTALQRFDMILGADILYDEAHHDALLALLPRVLADGGAVLLTDQGREEAAEFIGRARADYAIEQRQSTVDLHETRTRVDLYTLTAL